MVTVDPADVSTDPNKAYFDKATLKKYPFGSPEWELKVQEQIASKKKSNTLYVGNLSFQTTEEQIFELFSLAGEVKLVFYYNSSYCKYSQLLLYRCLKTYYLIQLNFVLIVNGLDKFFGFWSPQKCQNLAIFGKIWLNFWFK